VFFAWSYRAEFLKAISIPTLILVVVWGAWLTFSKELSGGLSWGVVVLYGLSFSFFAVTCHRLVLMGSAERFKPFSAIPGYRELRFVGWLFAIYAIQALLAAVTWMIVQNAAGRLFAGGDASLADWGKQLVSIPSLYVLARLSLTLPATAIDRSGGLRWSWARTRGNGWRIFVVVGLFPWFMDMVFDLVSREGATVVEQVALFMLACVVIAIEVVALSLTYRDLAANYATAAQAVSGEIQSLPSEAALDSFHDLPQVAMSRKLGVGVKIGGVLLLAYLLIGTLLSHAVDCHSELISSAASPGGTYKAELLKRTCKKNSQEQGLILDIVKTASPNVTYSYPLARTVPGDVEVVWSTDRSLMVKHAGSLDAAALPPMLEGIQLVLEKKSERPVYPVQ
jgi:hypothetical protein